MPIRSSEMESLARQALQPQEALLATKTNKHHLFIGLPKETSPQENRICLTPDAVGVLSRNGHRVVVEKGAGEASQFTDADYSEAGAQIAYSTREVLEADLILKIDPLALDELAHLKPGKTLISALPVAKLSLDYLKATNEKKATGIAFELIQDKVGGMPVVRAMSEIAGSTVLLIAAEYLSSVNQGKGVILGGITGVPPTKVVILGAGTVAEYAARTALGLGAEIKIFDKHIYKLRRIKYAIGQQAFTSTIDADTLCEALARADVVIGAIRAEDGNSPCIVTEEMVASMKPNSVIIDVSIDQGGCFETSETTTHEQPTFKKYGVIHYCVPNIASRVARTASTALSHIFTPFLLQTGTIGGIEEMVFTNRWFMRGVYSYKGNLTNAPIARKFDLPYKDLNLFMAARL